MVNSGRLTVAIFGGSFDPPHRGHQQIVTEALRHLDIDRLIVLPAYLNPFKDGSLTEASQRLEWCKTLFAGIPNVIVSDYEIRQGHSVKTAQSVRHFQKMYDVKYLVIGADNLSTLTQWYDFEWLNAQITWAVVTRPGYELKTDMLRSWTMLTLNVPVSSTAIRTEKKIDQIDSRIIGSVKNILEG
ncbi:MAG: nicotinate (nicotinamide) nucleotide adenylyltransferase [Sulfurovum sp.]|nr:nicotinate (nicotinamide) nucleotide adenylyltransferase [Sulfurovum sp.]